MNVLDFWHTLKRDDTLDKTDRVIGCTIARLGGRIPTAGALVKLVSDRRITVVVAQRSLDRLDAGGYLTALRRPNRRPVTA